MSQMIYIADDEKNIRNLIAAFLCKEGYEVEEFETGDLMMETGSRDLVWRLRRRQRCRCTEVCTRET